MIEYCHKLWTWIIGQTLWTEADQILWSHTFVDGNRIHSLHQVLRATHEAAAAAVVVSLNTEDDEWAKYKSNNLVSVDRCDCGT